VTASTLRWPLYALVGLLVALAIALLATRLVSERIGISSEPITAGESLSPKRDTAALQAHHRHQSTAPPAAPTSTIGSGSAGPSSTSPSPSPSVGSSAGASDSGGTDGKDTSATESGSGDD
jgi:hypothetical protein